MARTRCGMNATHISSPCGISKARTRPSPTFLVLTVYARARTLGVGGVRGMQRLIIGIILAAVALPHTTRAAMFTVNSTVDAVDATPGNGTCATAQGACTLRAAI